MSDRGTETPLRKPSQNARILEVLSDGREHEMRDIHRLVGFCRLNSRVAELRNPKHGGHNIVCRREGTSYFYKLVAAPSEVAQSQRLMADQPPVRATSLGAVEQLSLLVSAAAPRARHAA